MICGAHGACLSFRLDGAQRTMLFHPTWNRIYAESFCSMALCQVIEMEFHAEAIRQYNQD